MFAEIAFGFPLRYNQASAVRSGRLRSWVVSMLSGSNGFHIGDKVVYPNHGVGVIEQISSRTIGESVAILPPQNQSQQP